MNARRLLVLMAIALIPTPLATAASPHTAYVLTQTIPQPPSPSNGLSPALVTDDYLVVGAASFSRPGIPGTIDVYDPPGDNLLRTVNDPQTRGFLGLTFGGGIAIDGNHLAATDSLDSPPLVHIFDVTTGQLRHTLQSPIPNHPRFGGGGIAISGDTLVVGAYALGSATGPSYPAALFVYDAVTGALRHTINRPANTISWAEIFDISGNTIAIGSPRSGDSKVFLYDAISGNQIDVIPHPTNGIIDSLTLKGDKLLLGQTRGDAPLVDVTSHQLLQTFESPAKHNLEVSGAYFTFAGDDILVGSFGSLSCGTTIVPEARIFDAVTGAPKPKFTNAGPADRFFSMSGSPSGDRIAIVRRDAATLRTEVQIYTQIPEPGSAILAVMAAAAVARCRRSALVG